MRELAGKITKDREQHLNGMAAYLRHSGVDATLTEESVIDSLGMRVNETIIKLKGQNIHKIRLVTMDYAGIGNGGSVCAFHYEIVSDKPLTSASRKAIDAKTKLVKENKLLGLFGGKAIDIKWVGRDIAEPLNSDTELSRLLVESASCNGSGKLRIQVKSPSVVEILGHEFVEPPLLLRAEMIKTKAVQAACNKLFRFEIYARIAKRVNDVLSAN